MTTADRAGNRSKISSAAIAALLMVSCLSCRKASLYPAGRLVTTVDLYSLTTRYWIPITLELADTPADQSWSRS